jgi:lactoylglutathione lyase
MQFLHTMVRVSNLEASLDFYCGGLGLSEISRVDNEKGRFTLVFLAAVDDLDTAKSTQSPLIELTWNWDTEEYFGGRNFGHLAFRVANIYQICQKLADSGVVINRPPRDGHMAFVRSPDNISIELLQSGPRLASKEPWASMGNLGEW